MEECREGGGGTASYFQELINAEKDELHELQAKKHVRKND